MSTSDALIPKAEKAKMSRFRGKVIVIAVLAVIGLAVGLGVGLSRRSSSSSDDSDSSADTNSTTPSTNTSSNGTWWSPAVGDTWQIVLLYALNDTNTNASVYDIDLFDNEASTIEKLHKQDRKVICYFSAGSYEDFRPDSGDFLPSDYGNPLEGWPGENWANTTSTNVRNIMLKRMDLAVSKGCDGVDPDNIDGYENKNGLGLTEDDAVDYLTFLANGAHARNMSIGLKNGGAILPRVIDLMQWEVNEQCLQYNECDLYTSLIEAGKPVFHIEYPSSAPEVSTEQKDKLCNDPTAANFSTVLKNLNLDDWIDAC